MYIAIEALIGAGKSTLVSKLAERDSLMPFFEPVTANPFLNLYYEDPKRWAYAMQVNLLFLRYRMSLEAYLRSLRGETCVLDRSIYGDAAFALVQKWDGYFTDAEFESYRSMHETLVPQLAYPDLIFWLEISPEAVVERIKKRSRDCEAGLPLDYLKKLNEAYQIVLAQLSQHTKIIRIDANPDAETVYQTVKKAIQDYRESNDATAIKYR